MKQNAPARKVTLKDLLTDEQITQVLAILNKYPRNGSQMTKDVRNYLHTIDAQLQAKGVLTDYLTYVIEYLADTLRQSSKN